MKKLLGILVIGLLFCSIGYAKTKITEVKRSVKEDGEGILKLKEFHALNAPHAINPVSVSDFLEEVAELFVLVEVLLPPQLYTK